MILLLLILIPLLGAAVVALSPDRRAYSTAVIATVVPIPVAVIATFQMNWGHAGFPEQLGMAPVMWFESLGISLRLGVDSVALFLVLLTVLLGPICVIASKTAITKRVKTYFVCLLVLQASMTGVFAARDLILFYICFEFTLVPMYVLINLYGSTNRRKAATKFFLFTFTGSVIALAGLVYVAWFAWTVNGQWDFEISSLGAAARTMPASAQAWVLLALLIGFSVKVPLFPLHTWLPLAHTEAPTAGSVLLASVLLKLGTYGLFRFAIPFAPVAIVEYAPLIASFCIVGIVYAGLICWVQKDIKKLVAYSSVSHLGFCVLGLVSLNSAGLTGSVLYMISHGLSTGALFLMIGMIYERYHTRSMNELGGLAAKMPIWATFMVFFVMASIGLPGLNGFVSEFLCLLGAFQAGDVWGSLPGGTGGNLGPWFAVAAGTGMVIAAIYLLFMVGKVVFGPLVEPAGHKGHHDENALPQDINGREIGILLPLAAGCLIFGLYPQPLINAIEHPITNTINLVQRANANLNTLAPQELDVGDDSAQTEAGHE